MSSGFKPRAFSSFPRNFAAPPQSTMDGYTNQLHVSANERCVLRAANLQDLVKSRHLPLPLLESWRQAIESDNEAFVAKILSKCHLPQQKMYLMWGCFTSADDCNTKHSLKDYPCYFSTPFVLAACLGSLKVLEVFLQQNSFEVDLLEPGVNNVFHCLILAAAHSTTEDSVPVYSRVYQKLSQTLRLSTKDQLFKQENDQGFRPLELAMHHQVLYLAEMILNEEGIYCHTQKTLGLHRSILYDVTDYESWGVNSRRAQSPIMFLFQLEKNKLSDKALDILESPLFKNWIKTVFIRNCPLLIVWFFIRLVYFLMFYISDMSFLVHASQKLPVVDTGTYNLSCAIAGPGLNRNVVVVFLSVLTFSMLIFDVVELTIFAIQQFKCRKSKGCIKQLNLCLSLTKNFVVHNTFYRVNHAILVLGFFVRVIVMLTGGASDVGIVYVYVLINFSAVWSLLYFVQLLPGVGQYVTSMQRMVSVMINFSILFAFLYLSFTYMFYVIFLSHGVCTVEFGTADRSFYAGFLIMLNVIEMHEVYEKYPMVDRNLVSFLHIIYIFLVGILLLNFLIALQASATDRNAGLARVTRSLQMLSAALLLEQRFSWLTKRLIQRIENRYLEKGDSKIFLPCVIQLPSKMNSTTPHAGSVVPTDVQRNGYSSSCIYNSSASFSQI